MSAAKRVIRVGHSPDPDDAFMFYALAHHKLDTGELEFRHQLEDIETLNRRALQGELEVTALSVHAYAYVHQRYALLSCGASMGDRYGPIVVAREPMTPEALHDKTIAVPGTLTTAFLVLRLVLRRDFAYEVMPFDTILAAVQSGRVDAGLIIHEGQLTFQDLGLKKVLDLGEWWYEQHELPLPLGANGVRRDLGRPLMKRIDDLIRQSIRYALEHRHDALDYAVGYARDMGRAKADEFVGMYVNQWTLDWGRPGRAAVQKLLHDAHEAGIVPEPISAEFVDGGGA